MKNKKRERTYILRGGLIIGAIVLLFSIIQLQIQLNQTVAEYEKYEQQYEEEQLRNEELNGYLENEELADYIERVAREHGYIMPGERVYYDISGN